MMVLKDEVFIPHKQLLQNKKKKIDTDKKLNIHKTKNFIKLILSQIM